jgi:hypothetical protein
MAFGRRYMHGGSLGGVTVIAAAGLAGTLVALLFGAIQLGRSRLSFRLPRRHRRHPLAITTSDAGDRLAVDVEGVVELVRTDRLRASARAEIEALTLAETLLARAVARYRASATPQPAPAPLSERHANAARPLTEGAVLRN